MTTAVQDAEAAKRAVEEAEADLLSGKRSVSAAALHKLQDAWRHATLTAQRDAQKAQRDYLQQRLDGLTAIGEEVDKLAQSEHTEQLAAAVRDIAAACDRFRTLADAHDADVAALAAAAKDLRAEPAAPGGPRETSSYVALTGDSVTHRRVTVRPLGRHVHAAIGHAVSGDVARAVDEVKAAATAPEPRRPDYLLRNVRSGMLVPIYGSLTDGMRAQLQSVNPRSGELVELSNHDVDLFMRGELA